MTSKNKVSIFAVVMYVTQGVTALSGIAIPLLLRKIGFTITQIATLGMIASIPWFLKILWGAISDNYTLFGNRRKSYISMGCILSSLGWVLRFLFGASSGFIFWAISGFIAALGWCFVDIAGDGLIVEASITNENSSKYQNLCWGARALGSAITALAGGILCKLIGYVNTIGIVSIFPLIPLGVLWLVKEKKVIKKSINICKAIVGPIKVYIKNKQLLIISLFIFLGMLSPSYGLPWFFRMKDLLGFDEAFLGLLGSIGSLSIILGAIIYHKWLRSVNLVKLLKISVFIWVFNTASVLFIYNKPTAIVFEVINAIIGHIAFVPLLAIAARICQKTTYEASTFAMICSLKNLTASMAGIIGAKLFVYIGFYPLVIISTITTLICYPVIKYIKIEEK